VPAPVEVVVSTDGGARGNPGPAGIGAHIASKSGKTLAEVSEAIGHATNNVAEYTAVIRGLERALEMRAKRVHVRADSLLVVEQLAGNYRVKNPTLRRLHEEAQALIKRFEKVTFEHVPRARNKKADALVNKAIDEWEILHEGEAPPPQSDQPSLFE
jgi:ribonuclease H / adenosylcobalamin/alpha-ribazole phosphatase